ncbi:wax ester/triacylglycerol synthase family O-acyltransferase [Pseudohalioglobus sediminis]|uniref:diacylglycerol O-acyltransferase n=1 Tax=Pseudohalioglobus sediminis TaxID=2606449 RepID=A0A5B0X4C2_9GAMM|nr:wax ester/triacylglycerol synthase family O-acyltransferase [Pseudohalioglobus sediminis]KAA1194220.1 wax ester/triacylglycerol synthase family O-acyltransferase [Pseudohalioglobus sediminis]
MKQLGILDSAFINLEQSNTPQHVGGLGIYDPSTAAGGFVRFKDVISSFERRLNKHPLFRTRLIEVPGGLDRPYWVKDANFDVEFHLRHIALPEPGDWRQLCIQVARLHSRPLDMSRPLWEAYIIEGLDNIPNLPKDCFAIYTKMHHALVDGAGGSSFMALIHDLVPNPGPDDDTMEEPRLVDVEPSVTELLAKASVNTAKNTLGVLRGTARNSLALGRYALDVARKEIPAPDIDAPKTVLNRPVGPHRVFDAAEFPLEGFKDIKNAAGTTINDVALAVVGGALKRYLEARGDAPETGSLAAGIPLNMRTRRDTTDDNNQVGSVYASLHTDIDNPLERLQAVHQSTAEAKESGEQSPLVDVLKIAGVFSPAVTRAVAGLWSRNELSKYLPVNISTVVTNVQGPDFPLYCAGAEMVDYYGLGVLTPGMGLFHAAFSYAGKLTLAVLGDRQIMPDPEFYHDCLVASYEELYAAATEYLPASRAAQARAKVDASKRKRAKSASPSKPAKKQTPARKKAAAGKKPAARKSAAGKSTKAKTASAGKARAKAASKTTAKSKTTARKKVAASKRPATKGKAPAKRKAAARRKTGTRAKVKPKLS